MAERKLSDEASEQRSLLTGLGSTSPKPRVMLGGMFCSVEGAFENKTLNFESFNASSARRQIGNRCYLHTLSESSTDTPQSLGLHNQTITHTTEDQQVCGRTQEVRPRFINLFFLVLFFDVATMKPIQ